MIAAWNVQEIIATLTQAFSSRYSEDDIRLVGLLFAPPDSNLGKSEITKSLDYFHHRSGEKIDFFCAGYRRYGEGLQFVVEREVSRDRDPWFFNVIHFETLRQEVQNSSSWKYSGEADLILLNARKGQAGQKAVLDWSSAICCDLEKMKKDQAIESTRRFFEDIFRFAEEYVGQDPVWDLSNRQGVIKVKAGLTGFILSLLPKYLQEFYSGAKHLAVRNIALGRARANLDELRSNGDFIVVVEHLLHSPDEAQFGQLTLAELSDQLENLLSAARIRVDVDFSENVNAICEKPIVALRAAVVAARLARKIQNQNPQKELSLNLLRRDILFGVTGIDKSLKPPAVKKCISQYDRIVHCLVGAWSDVVSSLPESDRQEAIRGYSRLCSLVYA